MKVLLGLVLTASFPNTVGNKSDLLLIEEVREDQATIYIGESRYYLDRASISSGRVESVPYHSARTFMTRPNQPASVSEISVVCNHPTLGFAIAVRKIGVAKANSIEYSFDQGSVSSLADFDLKRLDEKPVTVFSKVAHAICNIAQPVVVGAPSNNSFKPRPLRGSA